MITHVDHNLLLSRARLSTSRPVRPFLRWAGSKRRLLPQIIPHLPQTYSRYYELFLGGGSLSTLLEPPRATLSDVSPELMNCWTQVRDCPSEVLARVRGWALNREMYYSLRAQELADPIDRAAKFIYLNKGAFNGLYRVNRSGVFNVPWGAPKSSAVVDDTNVTAVAQWLSSSKITLRCGPFDQFLPHARRGDLVFLDPPYHSASASQRDFRHYNKDLFSWADQVRLADLADRARRRGAHVLVTNSTSQDIDDLYPNFVRHDLIQHSTMAANSGRRTPVREALFVGSQVAL